MYMPPSFTTVHRLSVCSGKAGYTHVVLTTKDGREIRTRCITQPTDHQKIILEHLGWELPRSLHPIQM